MFKKIKHFFFLAKKEFIRHWISYVFIILMLADMGNFAKSMYDFKHDKENKIYPSLIKTINTADKNDSVEKVGIATLVKNLKDEQDDVFFIRAGEGELYVLAKDGNKTMYTEKIPKMSMIFSLENRFLDKDIKYKWIEPPEKPELLYIKLITDGKFITFILILALVYVLVETSGINPFKKNFKGLKPKDVKGSLDDLIGYAEIKEEAKQLLGMITKVDEYKKYGIEGTFNILLSGREGTGKSVFAKALAKELNFPIVSATGSLDEIYVGSGAKKIREMFKQAYALAADSEHNACLLFIDEAHGLLRRRGSSDSKSWEDDTRNELLSYLEGSEKSEEYHIVVIMASNFNDAGGDLDMDPSMLRRFAKKIHFRDPTLSERIEILNFYLSKVEKKESNIDVEFLGKIMSGLTPSLIKAVVQEAGLLAFRDDANINTDLLMKSFERSVIGQSSRDLENGSEHLRKQIAIHEIGHFLIEYHCALEKHGENTQAVKKDTSILKVSSESLSHIGALGFALKEQSDNRVLKNIEEFEFDIKQLYGGVAAEAAVYGSGGITTGASDDIQKVTKILKHMILENNIYGASKLNYSILKQEDALLQQIEKKSIELYNETNTIISKHRGLLVYLADRLIEKWVLTKDDLFEEIERYSLGNTKSKKN